MKLLMIPTGYLEENAYLYYDENTQRGVMIDPGDEPDKLMEAIKSKNVNLVSILLTHSHFDHVGAVEKLRNQLGVPVYGAKDEIPLLPFALDKELVDGEMLDFETFSLEVIATPGHTVGSVCYFDKEQGVLFSGDTLFRRSVGRADLPTGDWDTLVSSIKNRLYTLEGEISVHSGHGDVTNIAEERANNPFVK